MGAARDLGRHVLAHKIVAPRDLVAGGRAPGADRPDRLVGDDQPVGGGIARQAAFELGREPLQRPPGQPFLLGLADAEHDQEPVRQRRLGLGAHDRIGLAQPMPPLGVPDDHGLGPRILEHRRADRAGEGTLGLLVAVLPADDDPRPAQLLGHPRQHGRRREDAQRAGQRGARPELGEPASQRVGLGPQAMHLPIAEDDRCRQRHHGSGGFGTRRGC